MTGARLAALALHGGPPVRREPMPARRALGPAERAAIEAALDECQASGRELGYQGPQEEAYTAAFVAYQGVPGHADAVATGTAGLYVALAALQLPRGSHVLVSPVTDPGTLNAVVLNGLVPVLVDAQPGSYLMGAEQAAARLTPAARALLVVHANGLAAPMGPLLELAARHGLRVVEDCSQAHGASLDGRKVGTFGDLAVFSTMFSKNHATGGCGGVIYTRDLALHRLARAHADRGKPFWDPAFTDRDPSTYLFPALNLNLDELSCAIGRASLARLDEVRTSRIAFAARLRAALEGRSRACAPEPVPESASPFFQVVAFDATRLRCDKATFAAALAAEGIPVRGHYPQVAAEWRYLRPHLSDGFACPNAVARRDAVFHLPFNENHGDREAADIAAAIEKIERAYAP
ncbi:MAG: DegT/DnrJ/EryC1/StrS family aminotransferase [Anaeromyxobacter sp.]